MDVYSKGSDIHAVEIEATFSPPYTTVFVAVSIVVNQIIIKPRVLSLQTAASRFGSVAFFSRNWGGECLVPPWMGRVGWVGR